MMRRTSPSAPLVTTTLRCGRRRFFFFSLPPSASDEIPNEAQVRLDESRKWRRIAEQENAALRDAAKHAEWALGAAQKQCAELTKKYETQLQEVKKQLIESTEALQYARTRIQALNAELSAAIAAQKAAASCQQPCRDHFFAEVNEPFSDRVESLIELNDCIYDALLALERSTSKERVKHEEHQWRVELERHRDAATRTAQINADLSLQVHQLTASVAEMRIVDALYVGLVAAVIVGLMLVVLVPIDTSAAQAILLFNGYDPVDRCFESSASQHDPHCTADEQPLEGDPTVADRTAQAAGCLSETSPRTVVKGDVVVGSTCSLHWPLGGGEEVSWDVQVQHGYDAKIAVWCSYPEGTYELLTPAERRQRTAGRFVARGPCTFIIGMDNRYSWLNRKTVTYCVAAPAQSVCCVTS